MDPRPQKKQRPSRRWRVTDEHFEVMNEEELKG
jgi:hypothetical protein